MILNWLTAGIGVSSRCPEHDDQSTESRYGEAFCLLHLKYSHSCDITLWTCIFGVKGTFYLLIHSIIKSFWLLWMFCLWIRHQWLPRRTYPPPHKNPWEMFTPPAAPSVCLGLLWVGSDNTKVREGGGPLLSFYKTNLIWSGRLNQIRTGEALEVLYFYCFCFLYSDCFSMKLCVIKPEEIYTWSFVNQCFLQLVWLFLLFFWSFVRTSDHLLVMAPS